MHKQKARRVDREVKGQKKGEEGRGGRARANGNNQPSLFTAPCGFRVMMIVDALINKCEEITLSLW